MNSEKETIGYDIQKRAKAGTAALFRGVVAAYIAYLGYRLIKGAENALFIAVGIVFILSSLVFCYYIYIRWRKDIEAAKFGSKENNVLETEIEDKCLEKNGFSEDDSSD